MDWQGIVCLVVIGLLFLSLCLDKVPPDISTLAALLMLWCSGILTTEEALAGWSNSATITVGALFVCVEAAQKVTWLTKTAKKAFGRSKNGSWSIFKQMVVICLLSSILNNTPLVVFFAPVVRDWARSNGFAASKFLMPLSYSAILGGTFTVIGNSATLIVQGLLIAYDLPTMGIFDPALVSLPICAVGILYMSVAGYLLLPDNRKGQFRRTAADNNEYMTEIILSERSKIVGLGVHDQMLALFGGQATPIKLLRPRVEGAETTVHFADEPADGHVVVLPHIELRSDEHRVLSAQPDDAANLAPSTSLPLDTFADSASDGHSGSSAVDTHPITSPRARSTMTRATRDTPATIRRPSLGSGPTQGALLDDATLDNRSAGTSEDNDGFTLERNFHQRSEHDADAADLFAIEEQEHYVTLAPIGSSDVFMAGDRLILSVEQEALLEAYHEHTGVLFMDAGFKSAPGEFPQAYEVVLAAQNPFVGQSVQNALPQFSSKYCCIVLGLRRNDVTHIAGGGQSLKGSCIAAGDALLLLGKASFKSTWRPTHDFYAISRVGDTRVPMSWWQYCAVVILLALFVIGASGAVAIEQVAMVAAVLNVVCGFVTAKQAYQSVQLDLLMLIGASLGIGKAMETSGLASEIAGGLASLSMGPSELLFVLYFVVLAMTETISSNSAAALAFPIAVSIAKAINVSVMPFVMVVVFASSCGFAVPIANQCHLIVMQPGGYSMKDFLKVGLLMDLIIGVTVSGLVPWIWRF